MEFITTSFKIVIATIVALLIIIEATSKVDTIEDYLLITFNVTISIAGLYTANRMSWD
jgi:hypothetical protein